MNRDEMFDEIRLMTSRKIDEICLWPKMQTEVQKIADEAISACQYWRITQSRDITDKDRAIAKEILEKYKDIPLIRPETNK